MKLLMVTRADDNFRAISELTHPILRRFAKKWGADFLVLSKDFDSCTSSVGKLLYRFLDVYDLLDEYDRVLNLDSDIVINKNCPDLFEIVSSDKIGAVLEDRGSRLVNRRERILGVQKAWGDVGWREGYINSGVLIASKAHKEIFNKKLGRYWEEVGFDSVHFGYHIHRLGFEIHEMHWRHNHMSIFSEEWNGKPSRFNSHVIHYAGGGRFPDKGNRTLRELIRDDITKIYGDKQ